jgi:hypothetical protein
MAFVDNGEIILNEEHVDSKWLSLNNFIEKINWDLNKEELKKVLETAIKRELFFKKEKIDDFRKKAA